MTDRLALFAAVFVTLYAAHQVADHWVQTDYQARTKGDPGWKGRWACFDHVVWYTVTAMAALALLATATGATADTFNGPQVIAGMLISAVTHYIADRRAPLARIAGWAGLADFYTLGKQREGRDDNLTIGTGAYALDQSWHYGWLFVAALVIAA
jgi:hypothetical protein